MSKKIEKDEVKLSRRAWRKSPKNRYEIFIPHVRTSEPHENLCRFPSEEEVLIGRVTHEIRPNSSSPSRGVRALQAYAGLLPAGLE